MEYGYCEKCMSSQPGYSTTGGFTCQTCGHTTPLRFKNSTADNIKLPENIDFFE